MTTHLFIGPTRCAIPDGFVVHPPVAVGDVLRLIERRGVTRIAIVDGYFERMAAVWHKEILFALEKGIAVYGASSMGALRAAELDRYGMIGVGGIYRDFRSGKLVADDEVAVAHLPAAQGYAPVSDAMVDLRDGLARAVKARVIDARSHDHLIERLKATFYRERSWALARTLEPRLATWTSESRKSRDAKSLVRALRAPHRKPKRIVVPRTWAIKRFADELDS